MARGARILSTKPGPVWTLPATAIRTSAHTYLDSAHQQGSVELSHGPEHAQSCLRSTIVEGGNSWTLDLDKLRICPLPGNSGRGGRILRRKPGPAWIPPVTATWLGESDICTSAQTFLDSACLFFFLSFFLRKNIHLEGRVTKRGKDRVVYAGFLPQMPKTARARVEP